MPKKLMILLFLFIILLVAGAFSIYNLIANSNKPVVITPNVTATANFEAAPTVTKTQVSQYFDPVKDFKARVTKKPFGVYITPQNSPVQPERFTGYHTGADAEYEDITSDVPVYAFTNCKVILSETASGYGGVFMVSFNLNGVTHSALYGHIRPSSLPKVGMVYRKGDPIAVLGTGYSQETDGERRHLHFAILSDARIDIKGYVQSKSELSGWIDPLTLL